MSNQYDGIKRYLITKVAGGIITTLSGRDQKSVAARVTSAPSVASERSDQSPIAQPQTYVTGWNGSVSIVPRRANDNQIR